MLSFKYFHFSVNCRFCLKNLSDCETQVPLNRQIRKQFYSITQMELNPSEVYSQNICEKCFNSTQNAETFRKQLIENQQKLEALLEEELVAQDHIKEEPYDLKDEAKSSRNESTDEIVYEEYLDQDSEENQSSELIMSGNTSRVKKKSVKKKLCSGESTES